MQTTNFLETLNSQEINKLTEQVKETIATSVGANILKGGFTAADLWNIQRMKKGRAQRRGIMYAF